MDGHIRLDDRGVAYVGVTRLKLIHFVMAYRERGGSMEGLGEAYDRPPAANFHGALTNFLDHREEVEEAIRAYRERSERRLPKRLFKTHGNAQCTA